jgi:hypothetical protein
MSDSQCRAPAEVAQYVHELACELAVMARAAGHSRLSFLLEMVALEAADLKNEASAAVPSPDCGAEETNSEG